MSRGRGRILTAIGLVSLLGGCAEVPTQPFSSASPDPARDFVRFARKLDRLKDIAFPLSVAAAALCQTDVQATYGMELHDQSQYSKLSTAEYRETAIQYYGLHNGVTIQYVHPTLPAGAAGLHARTRVISLDGEPLDNKTAQDASEIMYRLNRRKEGPLHIVVQESQGIRELDLYSVPACKYPIVLVQSDLVNAYADGPRIIITTGMLDFTASDAELAVVIGHEIAHNALAHSDNIRLGNVLEALSTAHAGHSAELPGLATRFSYSKEFETQADYVGLYVAARAGYDISGVGQFWRRIARHSTMVNPAPFATTHPSYPERLMAFQSTLREIEEKIERGDALLPKMGFSRAVRQSIGPEDPEETEKATLR